MEEMKINKDMTIVQVFQEYPHRVTRLAQIMTSHGLHCVGCHVSAYETIEQGLMGHGMDKEKLDVLLKALNKAIEKD